jgi:hypothetical protein
MTSYLGAEEQLGTGPVLVDSRTTQYQGSGASSESQPMSDPKGISLRGLRPFRLRTGGFDPSSTCGSRNLVGLLV